MVCKNIINIIFFMFIYLLNYVKKIFFSPGQKFATIEAVTLSSVLLKNFKFELLPGQQYPPQYISSITFPMKDPLLVKVYKR